MRADDRFREDLHKLIAGLRTWAASCSGEALCAQTETPDYWRLAVRPIANTACPLELILHADQRYDASIGLETYENRPLDRPDLLLPMVKAIADGQVITRNWRTRSTGLLHSIETIVRLEAGTLTGLREIPAVASFVGRDDCVGHDRHYAPYKRS